MYNEVALMNMCAGNRTNTHTDHKSDKAHAEQTETQKNSADEQITLTIENHTHTKHIWLALHWAGTG